MAGVRTSGRADGRTCGQINPFSHVTCAIHAAGRSVGRSARGTNDHSSLTRTGALTTLVSRRSPVFRLRHDDERINKLATAARRRAAVGDGDSRGVNVCRLMRRTGTEKLSTENIHPAAIW